MSETFELPLHWKGWALIERKHWDEKKAQSSFKSFIKYHADRKTGRENNMVAWKAWVRNRMNDKKFEDTHRQSSNCFIGGCTKPGVLSKGGKSQWYCSEHFKNG